MAEQLIAYLANLYAVVLVILGVGFVIFIHELGHFLLAKWAGVKVEMFSIGFGPTLISYRKGLGARFGSSVKDYDEICKAEVEGINAKDPATIGETEYSLRLLPLGGFVKMLGEESTTEDGQKTNDPRAYHNKPVGARMAIISAGVIMNLIFGVACATWVHLQGRSVQPAVLGMVVAGQPAYAAGLRPGDEIVSLDGRSDISFEELAQAAQFSGAGQTLKLDVKRPGFENLVHYEIEPKRAPNAEAPTIGILFTSSLDLAPKPPKGLVSDKEQTDRILSAGPVGGPTTPVADYEALKRILTKYRDVPLAIVAERGLSVFANEDPAERAKAPKSTIEATVAPLLLNDFGMRMTPGPIAAVRGDSPAEKAGFQVGDRILSINGDRDYDPMRLPDFSYDHAGKALTFEVSRKVNGKDELATIVATPNDTPIWAEIVQLNEPLEIPGLGMAITIESRVAAITPGTPADKAKIQAGDTITSVEFSVPSPESEKPNATISWQKPVPLDGSKAAWPWLFDQIQGDPGPIRLTLGRGSSIVLEVAPVPGWFNPSHGMNFQILERMVPPQPFGIALAKGWRDTKNMALSIFSLIRNLSQGRLGGGSVGGPVKIGEIAFKVAKFGGLSSFFRFLGLLSVNLAVINFLPIPPLDGGQMSFLIAEKIRGRPLPENAVAYPTIVGLVLVLVLFVVVFFKDVMSYF